jgi:hypothetical protein
MPIPLEKKVTRKEQLKEILKDVVQLGESLESEQDKIVLRSIYWKIKSL